MIQSVKCLLLKHEDLSLNPLNSCKKLDTAENAYNSSAGQVEPGGALKLAGQSVLLN